MADERVGAVARRGDGLAGVASQLVNTATSFVTVFAAGALLAPAEFGRFAVAFALVTVALGGARAVIGGPLLAVLPRLDGPTARIVSGSALTCALVLGVAGALVAIGAGAAVPLLLALAPGLLAGAMHDACRFVSLGRHEPRHALALDVLWFATTSALVAGWYLVHGSVDGTTLALLWVAGAAVGVGWHVVTRRPRLERPGAYWSRTRHALGWYAGAGALAQVELYATLFLASALLTSTDAGGLRAAQLLALQPAGALTAAVAVAVIPAAVRLLTATSPLRSGTRVVRRWALCVVAGSVVIALAHRPLMELLLPPFADDYAELVVPLAAQAALAALVLPALIALRSVLAARQELLLVSMRGVLTVAAVFPLLQDGRLLAACWAVVGVHLVTAMVAVVVAARLRAP